MNLKKSLTKVLNYALISALILGSAVFGNPGSVLAAGGGGGGQPAAATVQTLDHLLFVTPGDSNLITGEVSSINLQLFDGTGEPFSGQVSASLTDAQGVVTDYPISGSNGWYSVTGVTPAHPGTYQLTITQLFNQYGKRYQAEGTVNVIDATATVLSGSLAVDDNTQVTAKLTGFDGAPLTNRAVTIDGSGVGSPSQTVTTLTDGTFSFSMTPSQTGTVNFIHGGVIVGSITVGAENAKVTTSGVLVLNEPSLITATLVDGKGNPLNNRTVQLDESALGLGNQTFTTLSDGTFHFNLTPTQMGTINFIYSGAVVGSIQVQPDFTMQPRLGGQSGNNAALSVEVAKEGWSAADSVILTRDDVLSDAMTAVPLSKKLDAPILMTGTSALDSGVLAEIKSLGATHIYIIGGTGAVSAGIQNELTGLGYTVERLGGTDRYATAAEIAARVGSRGTVYLAYGYGEPDALAADAFAAEQGNPILLTESGDLPASTQAELESLKPSSVILLGGTGVIDSSLQSFLSGRYAVERWGGVDRYGTEQEIFQNILDSQQVAQQYPLYISSALVSRADVAGGEPYGDALLAAALAAKEGGFVVTLPPDTLPSAISTFFLYNKAYIPSAQVVGSTSAVSAGLEAQFESLLMH
ncbi:Invasin/intimin cell-adhesion fragments [Acididesulfobacillus acetoxydans]|uniref:Cell wall binding repeat 2-containing protein n=1 Tax=Acididesulfobacillus acetoxydans TaxID=1561005 RepID=A0A8S0WKR9_9FIRM|nr:cell wall-binding repeat-containing protein [Acididesulfobacillus acetoxydans]CAA7599554.1 Invasin/intimin cell-adhesion fragments [Acididesulfobacillus acetoxydans]CEJ07749.1 Cell wall binding repeat 2-containing protein [Acididesulfobacillus acetoxydans]